MKQKSFKKQLMSMGYSRNETNDIIKLIINNNRNFTWELMLKIYKVNGISKNICLGVDLGIEVDHATVALSVAVSKAFNVI